MKTTREFLSIAALLSLVLSPAAAFAQSNVTAFGQVSISLAKLSGSSAQISTTGFGSGIGFKGIEDLGSGLSAYFHLENRFDLDTGAAKTTFWDEKTLVGLRGDWGAIQLGRFGNAYDDILGLADPFGDTVANMGHESALGEGKWSNSIGYYTPAMNGFSAAITSATKEDAAAGHSPFAIHLRYAHGPLSVGLGFAKNANNDIRSASLAGNYDFGPAKLFAGYTNSSNTGAGNARNMQIGVAIPVSAAGTVKAAFSNYKPNTDVSDREHKTGLGYWHNLSKRTLLFVDAARTSERAAGITDSTNAFDVGIFHKF
jgi:predicted porin